MLTNLLSDSLVAAALQNDKGKDVQLTSWSHGQCGSGIFFNVPVRIFVKYSENGVGMATTYVAKVNPRNKDDVFSPYRHHAMKKEMFFYQTLLPLLNKELSSIGQEDLRVPKYLHASSGYEKEVIIFEDLDVKQFKTYDREKSVDSEHAILMSKELGRFHAAAFLLQQTYAGQDLTEVFPYLVETWNVPDADLSDGFAKIFTKGIKLNVNLASALPEYEHLVPWLENVSSRAMETIKLQLKPVPGWTTICHGDYHKTNVMFRYNEFNKPIDIMMHDWQTLRLSSVGMELSYLHYSSFFGDDRSQFIPVINGTFYESMKTVLQDRLPYTLAELNDHVTNNHFGILLCFYLIPLSLCVKDPTEFFRIDENALRTDPNGLEKAKILLSENKSLKFITEDYFNAIVSKNLTNKI